jgi:hypothetical protein
MRTPPEAGAAPEIQALAIAVAWMLVAQLACVLAWDSGWLTRQAALVHWLLVGVVPPALALWGMQASSATDRA